MQCNITQYESRKMGKIGQALSKETYIYLIKNLAQRPDISEAGTYDHPISNPSS